ncbi:MAG TPA: hypothetical protein VEO56_10830 [Bacteroidota bacterium]|nr:hypothetical protein [Bacteroidota bacterium]
MALARNKRPPPDYRLQLRRMINERTHRPSTLLVLQTTKAFASFRYGLTVEEHLEAGALHLTVMGLEAPRLDLPGAGPAEFRKEYEDLSGDIRIVITGLDGSRSSVDARITAESVTLRSPVTGKAIEVSFVPGTLT